MENNNLPEETPEKNTETIFTKANFLPRHMINTFARQEMRSLLLPEYLLLVLFF